MSHEQDALLRSTEAATLLNITERTLTDWRRRGVGPAYVRLSGASNGQVRYARQEIDRFLRERTFRSTTQETAGAR